MHLIAPPISAPRQPLRRREILSRAIRSIRWRVPTGRRLPRFGLPFADAVAGNVQFHPVTGNVLFTANGVAMDPACCCGCDCPAGLPGTLTLSGHIEFIDPFSLETVCNDPFSAVLTASVDVACAYNGSFECGDTIFSVLLSLTDPPCEWTLLVSIDTNASTSRAGAGNVLGAYPDTSDGGFSFWLTSLVVS